MFLFFTVVQAIVAAALVAVILMQRNEGGGLGIGGSPSGMLSARGAADFLTRSTRWLAIVFVVLSIVLAAMAAKSGEDRNLESTLDRTVAPAQPADPLGAPDASANPAAPVPGAAGAPNAATPAPAGDPLAPVTQ